MDNVALAVILAAVTVFLAAGKWNAAARNR